MSYFSGLLGRGRGVGGASAAVHQPTAAERKEERARIGETFTQSSPNLLQLFGMDSGEIGGPVSIDDALKVPAIWCAVNFLSRTMAALPIKAFDKGPTGRIEVSDDPAAALFNRAANDETSAFMARQEFWQGVFTAGRAVAFIESNDRGAPVNLWPLDISHLRVARTNGRRRYHYNDGGTPRVYAAGEVLDIAFMPRDGGLSATSPIYSQAETIGLARAITRYGARFFDNGGVPAFTLSGPIKTAGGVARSSADMTRAVKEAAETGSHAITVPDGHTLTKLGVEPEKMQMIEAQRFVIEQVARIWGLPPAFLQDLTHGTFSNVEHQDLQLVKHLIAHWVKAHESEINLKIYGRQGGGRYLETMMDGLLRGDLKTRAETSTARVNSGQLTPNEARALENREGKPGGDHLFIQGAMVPLTQAAEGREGSTE